MKTKKTIFLWIIAISLSLLSCSSSDSGTSKENPLDAFLLNSGFNQNVTNTINTSTDDFVTGFRFSPSVNGKINAITLKIPDGNEFVKVNIWKVTGAVLMHTENMAIPDANVTVSKNISALSLTANEDYIICMHTNDAYSHSRDGGTGATYPIIAGNIVVKEYLLDPDFGGDFMPSGGGPTLFNGDLSFVFQKN